MSEPSPGPRDNEWAEFYEAFGPHVAADKVRDGCHPRMRCRDGAERSIVLVHGLSDSPYYVSDLADYFHDVLHYNVFLPLLHWHGLKQPGGMEGVELEEWKRNVGFAVGRAHAATPGHVSVGGLSTGGALAFYTACTSPKITGDLFLFSAALDLKVGSWGPLGEVVERLLRASWLSDILDARDADRPLVGNNPFKYEYVDKDGARELARLIKETDMLVEGFSPSNPFPIRVFAAHSLADDTADIAGIRRLQACTPEDRFSDFFIPANRGVTHAGLVLGRDVVGIDGTICTPGNTVYADMLERIRSFTAGG